MDPIYFGHFLICTICGKINAFFFLASPGCWSDENWPTDGCICLCFSQMDPVQKAVINHTFGVPQPLKKKQIISCNICHLRFNSTVRDSLYVLCLSANGSHAEVMKRTVTGRERERVFYQKVVFASKLFSQMFIFKTCSANTRALMCLSDLFDSPIKRVCLRWCCFLLCKLV